MATPDPRSLYELYRQIYSGHGSSLQPETPGANRNVAGGGDVLGGFAPSPTGMPWWVQGARPTAPGASRPVSPRSGFRGLPIPTGPGAVVGISNPHLERSIPGAVRDVWTAGTLLPWMLGRGMLGDGGPEEGARESDDTSSPNEQPPNRGGSTPPWLMGPAVLEERRQQSAPDDQGRHGFIEPDPNFRKLTRVLADFEFESASAPQAGRKKALQIESPPLAPEDQSPEDEPISPGSGNGGNCRDDEGNEPDENRYCDGRQDVEIDRCDERSQRRRQWPNFNRCVDRAKLRGDLCRRNGGMPPLSERGEWGIDDEHQIQSDKRSAQRNKRRANRPKGKRSK